MSTLDFTNAVKGSSDMIKLDVFGGPLNYGEEDNGCFFDMPEKIDSVHITYDGGRLCVSVNGQLVFGTNSAGNDFYLEISRGKSV